MTSRAHRLALLALLFGAASVAAAQAQTKPWTFSYGGQLLDSGKPLEGTVAIELKFYKQASGGNPLGIGAVQFQNVALQDGAFQVDATQLTDAELDLIFKGDTATYVEVLVNGKPYYRQKIVAVPYALRVPVDGKRAKFDDTTGKLTVGPSGNAAAGEFLTVDGSGNWVWQTPAAGAAGSIGTKTVDNATVPTAGQILKYDPVADAWKPSTLLPATPASPKFLQSDASGNLSWQTPGGGGDMAASSWDSDANGAIDVAKGGTNATSPSAARTNLGLVIGTDVQDHDATLSALAGVTTAADKLVYATGTDTFATTTLTSYARGLLDDADPTAARGTLGLGALATLGVVTGAELAANINIATTGVVQAATLKTGNGGSLQVKDADGSNFVSLVAPATANLTTNYTLTLPNDEGSSGQVLKTDGTGVLSWISPAASSGASGQIQFSNGSGGFNASSDFVFDGLELGIGVAAPLYPIHVKGSGPAVYAEATSSALTASIGVLHAETSNYAVLYSYGSSASGSIGGQSVAGKSLLTTSNDLVVAPQGGDLFLGVGAGPGTTVATISGGNFGIGTTSPTSPLHVLRSSAGAAAVVANDSASAAAILELQSKETSASPQGRASLKAMQGAGDGDGILVFETFQSGSPAERMRITPSGNVGIGIDPAERLDLGSGNIKMGWERVSASGCSSGVTCNVSCTGTRYVMGGGCEWGGGSGTVQKSYPSSDSGWSCLVSGSVTGITAWAICANIR